MFKKILVPLDGSELATGVFPQVIDLAKTQGAEITILNVLPDWGIPTSEEVRQFIESEAQKCEALLATAAKELAARGVKVAVACGKGEAAPEIIAYAEANGMDLIAMATHGRGEVAWVLGSVAEKVVSHAPVPVLLIRVLKFSPPGKKTEFIDLMERGLP
jgi:nucleotide-binding universal stress UspA family protein